jgi:magnesium-transporting ATPase (P-type)
LGNSQESVGRKLIEAAGNSFQAPGKSTKMAVPLEKLSELMESKDKKKVDELGGVASLAEGLGSDIHKGLPAGDIDQRKLKYGENKMERKPPPSILELFLDAMKDTTIIILLIAATISIIIGAITCSIHLGKTCPRKPLWDVGYIPPEAVR